MNYTYLHYQIGLTLLYGVGPKRARFLLELLPGIESLFLLSPDELSAITGIRKSFFKDMSTVAALETADRVIAFNQQHGITPLFYDDPKFPRRLKTCDDAPLMLYQKGHIDLNQYHFAAIVGTRKHTHYGQSICEELIQSFKHTNICVVSGLALGIDALSHQYCLENDVPTIAVLGHGLDRIYPYQNRKMAKEIVESGALLTEFIPGTKPDRENFPKRNRIVSGMCDATIVVESNSRGGSIITANLANDYNRDVFAFPGSIFQSQSAGCNDLIREQKAHLVRNGKDILQLMNWTQKHVSTNHIQRPLFPDLSKVQRTIVSFLSREPIQIDVLAHRAQIPISQLNTELCYLELEGVIQSLPGKTFCLL